MKRPPKWTGIGFLKLQRLTEQARQHGLAHHLANARYEADGTLVRITARNGSQLLVDPESARIVEGRKAGGDWQRYGDDGPEPVAYKTAREAIAAVEAAADAEQVVSILNAELAREKPRKSVVAAANARLDAIDA